MWDLGYTTEMMKQDCVFDEFMALIEKQSDLKSIKSGSVRLLHVGLLDRYRAHKLLEYCSIITTLTEIDLVNFGCDGFGFKIEDNVCHLSYSIDVNNEPAYQMIAVIPYFQ